MINPEDTQEVIEAKAETSNMAKDEIDEFAGVLEGMILVAHGKNNDVVGDISDKNPLVGRMLGEDVITSVGTNMGVKNIEKLAEITYMLNVYFDDRGVYDDIGVGNVETADDVKSRVLGVAEKEVEDVTDEG